MGGAFQTLSGSVPVIGALFGAGNLWVGWTTHLFHSLVFGLVYAALVTLVPTTYSDTVRYYGAALGWALALWLVAASIVMPLWLRLVGVSIAVPAFQVPPWSATCSGASRSRQCTGTCVRSHGNTPRRVRFCGQAVARRRAAPRQIPIGRVT